MILSFARAALVPAAALAPAAALVLAAALLPLAPVRAGVEFDNCQPTADGGISCDTRATGNTLMDDESARYGLFNDASPGWNEFDPDQGFEDDFGGNDT